MVNICHFDIFQLKTFSLLPHPPTLNQHTLLQGDAMNFKPRIKISGWLNLILVLVLAVCAQAQTPNPPYEFKKIWKNDFHREQNKFANISFVDTADENTPEIVEVPEGWRGSHITFDINGVEKERKKFPDGYFLWAEDWGRGRVIVGLGCDETGCGDLQLLDRDGKVIKDLTKEYNTSGTAFFSPKGNYFAVIGPDLEFYDRNGKLLTRVDQAYPGPDSDIKGYFSSDEKYFGVSTKSFDLWSVNGQLVLKYQFDAYSVGFSPDSSVVALSSFNELVLINRQGEELFRQPFHGIRKIVFLDNDHFVFSNNDDVWLGQVSTKKFHSIKSMNKGLLSSYEVLNGNLIADYMEKDSGKIVYIKPTGEVICSIDHPSGVNLVYKKNYILAVGSDFWELFKLEK